VTTYIVNVERTPDGWWYIEVPEVEGAMTQAKRLDQIEHTTRDLLSLALEVAPDAFDLDVRVTVPEDIRAALDEVKRARSTATKAEAAAREASSTAVAMMVDAGLPQRDIGKLLGVTHQRIAQISGSRTKTVVGRRSVSARPGTERAANS
jgi:predicted RNase H-like HicB family nuclease